MPGEESDGGRLAAMRQRERRIGARRGRGRDAGHDFKRNPVGGEMVHLLAEATEDAGVAALESDGQATLPRFADQDGIDLILRHRMDAATLADRNDLRGGGNFGQQGIARQGVMDHDVGLLEQTKPPDGDQIGGPRSGTDKDHSADVAIYHLFKLDRIYVIISHLIKLKTPWINPPKSRSPRTSS